MGPAKGTADCAYVLRAIGDVNLRNAQIGAPELVARIQTQKPARRAEVEWPIRYTSAKRSEASWPASILEKMRNFSVRA
jgi:hypothetical protein